MTTETSNDMKDTRDEIFVILSNHRRRYVLHFCKERDEPVTLSDLAEQVAAWEYDKPIEELGSAERKRVYTSLQQTHLPTMEKAGLIRETDRKIELTDRARNLDVYLDIVPAGSIPWGLYYLGVSAVSGMVLVMAWIEIIPDAVSHLVLATLIVGIFGISAAVHTLKSQQLKIGYDDRPPEIKSS